MAVKQIYLTCDSGSEVLMPIVKEAVEEMMQC